ncbi:hypothetical protein [Lutispora saccharofermentans]|uniref:Uncharacterized protein n=1 Tax=Lutispora saccharofermentans TaxID=3024236 RepID=A0ABT1NCN9_9FIRM|nr:hypothetical protein [Lutispora saccharofermentans]MCQ1529030.1 hypothetical protein [Lutispora saccharofermentans]
MGKGSNYYKKTLSEEEKCYSEPSSKNVDFYKKRIDELEDEIKMLKKLIKKREKYEELLKEKEKLVNRRPKGRKR